MKTVLIVKTGYPLAARTQAYRTFFRLGWKVAIVDTVLNQGIGIADVAIVVNDLSDLNDVTQRIFSSIGTPDAVLTFNDSGLVAASKIARHFGLNQMAPDIAKRVVNKQNQREFFGRADIPMPQWALAMEAEDINEMLDQFGEVVVKPVDRSASAGVSLVSDRAGSQEAFMEAKRESGTGKVLVEQYVDGPEFSVESIAIEGRQKAFAVTRKLLGARPHFIELGHSVPAALPSDVRYELMNLAEMANDALGITTGVSHTEIRLGVDGPVVIEVNARPPGDRIVDLLGLSTGINLYELLMKEAAGETLNYEDIVYKWDRVAAIRYLPSVGGRFESVTVGSLPPAGGPIVEISVTGETGMVLPRPLSNGARTAFAIACDSTEEEAVYAAEVVLASINISVSARA